MESPTTFVFGWRQYTHEVPKTGYKATNAYGSRSIFEGKTYVCTTLYT